MQPDHPPILVLSRKKPHLILLLVLSVLSGLSIFAGGADEPQMPNWLSHSWAAFLIISGSLALIAHLQRWDRERGMHVERGSLTIQAAAVIAYALTLPTYFGWGAPTMITFLAAAAWSGANLWEVKLISGDLQLIKAVRRITPGESNDAQNT